MSYFIDHSRCYGLAGLAVGGLGSHVQMMTLDLDDTQAALLLVALDRIIDDDKYPLSRGKLKPYPTREPLPPLKPYEPPRVGRGRRRGE